MRKFLTKVTLFSILVLIVVICINYWGDAARIFHKGYEKKIATILSKKKNATNISNYDERILQKEIVNIVNGKPDVLILGSSRTMLLNTSHFDNETFLINNSVSGASIEDIIAIYQMYKQKKILPNRIIMAIDPWLFNENNGQNRWKSIAEEYHSFYGKDLIKNEANSNKIMQLISLSYFQNSVKILPKMLIGKAEPIATTEKYNRTNTKVIDGSLIYGKRFRERTPEMVSQIVNSSLKSEMYGIENFDKLSSKFWKEFELLVKDIKDNNIILTFFLAPYHPIVYNRVLSSYPLVKETELKIIEFSKKNYIERYGSFNPNNFMLNDQDFYDEMHCKESGINKILNTKK